MDWFRAGWRDGAHDEWAAVHVWRQWLLVVLLRTVLVLGVVVAIPTMAFAARVGDWTVIVVDLATLAALVGLAFLPGLSYRTRAIGFLTLTYLLGIVLFLVVGPVLAAFLLSVPILTAILLAVRSAVVSLVVNAATTAVLGIVVISSDRVQPLVTTGAGDEVISWLVVTLNLVFVSGVITLSCAVLLDRLDRSVLVSRRLAAAVERSPSGVVIADADGRIAYTNSAARTLVGDRVEPGRSLAGALAGAEPAFEMHTLDHGWEGSLVLPGDDASDPSTVRRLDVEVHSSSEEDGQVQVVALVRDVTEERAMQEAMARSQRLQALGTLVGGTAHDFNNALAAMTGLSHVLRSDLDDPAQRSIVDDILLAADRAQGVVQQLMAFGRIRSHRDEETDVGLLLERDRPLLVAPVPSHVDLVVDAPPGLLVPLGPAELHGLLANLVTNAAHALRNRTRGTIRVTLTEVVEAEGNDTYARISVIDDGHGIDPDVVARVFDPFFTTKPPEEGTGLGLASVHGTVTAAGGRVDISSRLGAGTTVEVVLPARRSEGPAEPGRANDVHPTERTNEGTDRPITVLVVDDEELIVSSTTRLLERRGYAVTPFHDPLDARARIEAGAPFDVILTDMSMPTLSGLTLAQAVRSHLPRAAIVVMSGYGDVLTAEDLEHLGIAATIDKPFDLEDLVACIERALLAATRASDQE